MDRDLYDALSVFSSDAVRECSEHIKNNRTKVIAVVLEPLFRDGTYRATKPSKEIDFAKVVYDLQQKLGNLNSYKAAKIILRNRLSKTYKTEYLRQESSSLDEDTDENLLRLVINYLAKVSSKKFERKGFLLLYRKFENYIFRDLFTIFYFSPLHNFNGNIEAVEIDSDICIRRINPVEFSVISGLIDRINAKPDPHLMDLRFVIGSRVKKQNGDNLKMALEKFEKIVSSLKIFKTGELQLGGIYISYSEEWSGGNPERIRPESHEPSNKIFIMNKDDIPSYRKFFSTFKGVDFSVTKNAFLKTAIRRFGIAVDHRNVEDKIVDYIVSLESMYSTKGTEVVYKLSNRVALLLGKSDDERLKIVELLKKSYDIRSDIVHGNPLVPSQIKDKYHYSLEEISEELEKITRKSLIAFLRIIGSYKNRDEIQKEIDNAALDNRVLRKLHKMIR